MSERCTMTRMTSLRRRGRGRRRDDAEGPRTDAVDERRSHHGDFAVEGDVDARLPYVDRQGIGAQRREWCPGVEALRERAHRERQQLEPAALRRQEDRQLP